MQNIDGQRIHRNRRKQLKSMLDQFVNLVEPNRRKELKPMLDQFVNLVEPFHSQSELQIRRLQKADFHIRRLHKTD